MCACAQRRCCCHWPGTAAQWVCAVRGRQSCWGGSPGPQCCAFCAPYQPPRAFAPQTRCRRICHHKANRCPITSLCLGTKCHDVTSMRFRETQARDSCRNESIRNWIVQGHRSKFRPKTALRQFRRCSRESCGSAMKMLARSFMRLPTLLFAKSLTRCFSATLRGCASLRTTAKLTRPAKGSHAFPQSQLQVLPKLGSHAIHGFDYAMSSPAN